MRKPTLNLETDQTFILDAVDAPYQAHRTVPIVQSDLAGSGDHQVRAGFDTALGHAGICSWEFRQFQQLVRANDRGLTMSKPTYTYDTYQILDIPSLIRWLGRVNKIS